MSHQIPLQRQEDTERKYILLLDEHFTFRYYLGEGLRSYGHECIEDWDYTRATRSLNLYHHKNSFDLVVADFSTVTKGNSDSSSNGWHPQNGTPIIFLIGQATEDIMQTAKRLGARAIFEKRGDLADLLEKIHTLLSSETRRTKR